MKSTSLVLLSKLKLARACASMAVLSFIKDLLYFELSKLHNNIF